MKYPAVPTKNVEQLDMRPTMQFAKTNQATQNKLSTVSLHAQGKVPDVPHSENFWNLYSAFCMKKSIKTMTRYVENKQEK